MYIRNSGVENKGDESDAIVKSATGKIDRALRMVFLEYYSNHEVESCILPLRHVVDNSAPLLRKKVVNAAELAEVVIAGLLGRAEKIELRLPEVTGAGESVMTSAALGTPSIRLELWWRGRAYHVYEDDIAAVARWMELIVETMRQTKKYGWAGSRDEEKDEEERWAGADAMARLQEEIEQQRLMETDGVEAAQGLVSLVCRAIRDGVAPQAIITERNIRSQDYQDPLLAQATPSFDDDEAESTPMMVKKEQFELPKEGRQSAEEQERDERRAEKLALDRRRAQLEVHLVAEAYAWCTRE